MKVFNLKTVSAKLTLLGLAASVVLSALAQQPPPGGDDGGPMPFPGDFGPGGPGGPGMGGPGGPGRGGVKTDTPVLARFDLDKNNQLNAAERKAAREYLKQNASAGGNRGPGMRGGGNRTTPAVPGRKVTPTDVKSYPAESLYSPTVLRTFFLQFENADWEKELSDFKGTDVEVPAKVTVDGKVYPDVGVQFHGNSSYFMVGEGRKHSFHLSVDAVREDQRVYGFRTLNLLNSADDPTLLHTVLFSRVAQEYLPTPKANFVHVVVNGESWGVYINSQQFNKDFVKEASNSKKGTRWKVPGSPEGQGGMKYLGEDAAPYKKIYDLKTKEDPKAWADLAHLCKLLNETPVEKLEAALDPVLDVDGVLKFLALDNVLLNHDGFWTRASDYCLYQEENGKFHIVPYDYNETFSLGGGGPGGPGGFGPGMFIGPSLVRQGDKNNDQLLSQTEFLALANLWFQKLAPTGAETVSQDQFTANFTNLITLPADPAGPPGGGFPGNDRRGGRGRGGFDPSRFVAPGLFTALDADHDGNLSKAELESTFAKWFAEWAGGTSSTLDDQKLSAGLNAVLPRPNFGGPDGGNRRGPGGGGPGGPGGDAGVKLDPLVLAQDNEKPLASKLLAVPALRVRYLTYVRDIAQKWLDWQRLGPLARQYQKLITEEVKADTRKLGSTEDFLNGIGSAGTAASTAVNPADKSIKGFAEQRRAFLLNHAEIKKLIP